MLHVSLSSFAVLHAANHWQAEVIGHCVILIEIQKSPTCFPNGGGLFFMFLSFLLLSIAPIELYFQ